MWAASTGYVEVFTVSLCSNSGKWDHLSSSCTAPRTSELKNLLTWIDPFDSYYDAVIRQTKLNLEATWTPSASKLALLIHRMCELSQIRYKERVTSAQKLFVSGKTSGHSWCNWERGKEDVEVGNNHVEEEQTPYRYTLYHVTSGMRRLRRRVCALVVTFIHRCQLLPHCKSYLFFAFIMYLDPDLSYQSWKNAPISSNMHVLPLPADCVGGAKEMYTALSTSLN
jgi:hypothetical protein